MTGPALAAAWIGWAFALAVAWTLRRRMELVADAEHELRGAATAIAVIAGGDPAMQAPLARMTGGLADLAQARGGEPLLSGELEEARLAQVLGNVLANAAEHGSGEIRVTGRAHDGGVRLQVTNRGRGLLIASEAAEELGGSLSFEIVDDTAVATLDLPAA